MLNRNLQNTAMDDFGCFDYKKPAKETDQDWRTSYYRGHRYINDTRMGNKFNAKFADKNCYVRDPLLYEKLRSEYGTNYEWKYPNPDELRNPTLNMQTKFIKPFDESKMRFIKIPMKPIMSITQETYAGAQPKPLSLPIRPEMPTPVAIPKLVIDRSKPGYTKYLDPTATTQRLSYVKYPHELLTGGIAAHDNITFWNWDVIKPKPKRVTHEADKNMCDDYPANDCPKRRCEFQNQMKSVPHSGLITEVRENYLDPKYRKEYKEFDMTDVSPILVHTPIIPFAKSSEYTIYGSGEPVMKYV